MMGHLAQTGMPPLSFFMVWMFIVSMMVMCKYFATKVFRFRQDIKCAVFSQGRVPVLFDK
jgi:hypothetical protein